MDEVTEHFKVLLTPNHEIPSSAKDPGFLRSGRQPQRREYQSIIYRLLQKLHEIEKDRT